MQFKTEFIGPIFKEYRKKAKISQEKLAEKVDLAVQHYGRLERGTCIPTLLTFFKIIETLNIPLSEFGVIVSDSENKLRKELIKEIYLSTPKELQAYLNIIKSIKNLK